ncbi:uncharacterized protein CDAR_21481 [Caerostris darwini]|uniref:Uncharacterized protein n=1 Tax=Caerostris darwini TaxID=1538125 RepID=A0AAV4VYE3_9ARAC|nr:uncharacterized protein CDAR_21481 [Caerostris darwini]
MSQHNMVLFFTLACFGKSVFEFLSVVCSAGKIGQEDDALKKLVVRFSEKAAYNFYVDGKICLPKLHCFGLLAETIRGTTLELSGGNLFVLKYNLILSVIGLMVTYGVLIFQFK